MSDFPARPTHLDWALRYVRLGWPIFPLKPEGKDPLTEHGFKDATLNESQAREWWTKWPNANIGAPMGYRCFAVDFDIGRGGEESYEHLVNQHGRFPDTLEQVTGGGGRHLFFSMPDFLVPNTKDYLAPGVESRAKGNYVVLSPSVHPVTKRRYVWDGARELEEQPIAPAPAWLLDRLKNYKARVAPLGKSVAVEIVSGRRNDTLFKLACSQRRKGLTEGEILATLRAVNQARCRPPLEDGELRPIAGSSAKYQPEPRGNLFASVEPAEPVELPVNPADVEAAVNALLEKRDIVGIFRLAPDLAKLRPQFRAPIKAGIKVTLGRDWPNSLAEEFDRAIAAASEDGDGSGQKPPGPPARVEGGELPPGPDLLPYPLTDGGNGERLVRLFGDEIRYCTEMKKWLVWDGKRWAIDELNLMRQRGKQMARLLYLQAASILDDGRRKAMERHARASESAHGITNALTQAATEQGIPISAHSLDQQPFLLNCLNGVLDLRRLKLLPHNREFLITKLCPVPYDPTAECRKFLKFIHWAMGEKDGDAELSPTTVRLVSFLQRAFGYGLTGDVSAKCIFVFYGLGGNNGKTTLLTLFRELLGRDYASLLLIETVMAAKQTDTTARADLADLRGARFVQTSEVGKEDRLNEQRIKYLTQGMGYIKSRRLYENPLEFESTHKLFMDCNYRPGVRGTDKPIWRRLKLVPFEVTIPDDQIDLHLPDKLRAEMPGILAWAARGALAWSKEGLGEPPEVKAAVEDWQEHDDPLKEFLEDCCEIEEKLFVRVKDLMAAYLWWAKQGGERAPLGRMNFNERLESKGFKQSRNRDTGKLARVWEGLELKGEAASEIGRMQQMGML